MAPLIELDTTLKELYEMQGADYGKIYLSAVFPSSLFPTAPGLPVCTKYAYQDGLWPKDTGFQARLFTQVLPQWFAMVAGSMDLVMFDLDEPGTDKVDLQPRADTSEVLGQICEHQRPIVTYVRNASDVVLPPKAVLSVVSPIDCFEHLPALVPFDNQYRALSKRELALSGVSTPPSTVIDTVLDPDQVQDAQLRGAEVARMLGVVQQTPLPFVIKLPQARGGFGTLLVRSESELAKTLALLRPEVGSMLRQLNRSNRHLHPASLIVQELIPGSTVALCMFLPKTGVPAMLYCTEQLEDEQGHWEGSYMDYPQQSRLQDLYMPISEAIGAHLHRLGYHGPLGADIMVGPGGEHFVIDLNARLTASHLFGFVKGHLSVSRGLNHAAILSPIVNITLSDFRKEMARELEEGRVIIAGWCHGPGGERSVTGIMVAGEDRERMLKLVGQINALKKYGFTTLPTSK